MLFAAFTSIILSAGILILLPIILPAAISAFLVLAVLILTLIIAGSFIPTLIASTALAFVALSPIVQGVSAVLGAFFIGSVLYDITKTSEPVAKILHSSNSAISYATKFALISASLALAAIPIFLIPSPLASFMAISLLMLGAATIISILTRQIADIKDRTDRQQENVRSAEPEREKQSTQSDRSIATESTSDHMTQQKPPNNRPLAENDTKNAKDQDTAIQNQQTIKEAPGTIISPTPATPPINVLDRSPAPNTPTGKTSNANSEAAATKNINQDTISV